MPEMILQSKFSRFCLQAVSNERLNVDFEVVREVVCFPIACHIYFLYSITHKHDILHYI